ncbi:MAG: phosphotriesterase family protein [Anaerolineae bacterium]
MKVIRTVRGDIAPQELGITATHEHLYCDQRLCRSTVDFPDAYGKMVLRDPNLVVAELADFYAAGGRAVAEMTTSGWGRDVAVLKDISERSGIHVIAVSGFYIEDCLPVFVDQASIEELAEILIEEITVGAEGTNIRTGLLKSAISRPVIEGPEAKCARAIARAQRRTGVAITTHTSAASRFEVAGGNVGMQHLDLFEAEGVDPARVIVGHVDENADIRQLAALARRGAYVQFDVVGKAHWLLDETRVELLCRLVDQGYENHLLLSSDRCRTDELKAYGGPGYDHVLRNFVPKLRQAGFDDALLHRILVENPARALAFQPGAG